MSEFEGKRGEAGKPPAGTKGGRGGRGGKGGKGERGRIPRSISVSFLIVSLLAAGVLGLLAYYVLETRQLGRENRETINYLQALQRQNRKLIAEALKSKTVQCAQRADMAIRVARTDRLLNPQKQKTARARREARKEAQIVFRAIPRALIVQGQATSQATLKNLSILDCKEGN